MIRDFVREFKHGFVWDVVSKDVLGRSRTHEPKPMFAKISAKGFQIELFDMIAFN